MDQSPTDRPDKTLNRTLITEISIFLIGALFSYFGPHLMANDKCYILIGCSAGFFGYDAVLHFVSGVMTASIIIWLMQKYPKVNLFHEQFWKNVFIVVAIAALVAVSWELVEYGHDQFRMTVLHQNLTSPNRLNQPNVSDTMGDMTFSILAAALTTKALKRSIQKK